MSSTSSSLLPPTTKASPHSSGLTVITTSSPKNFALCKSLGADATFDYNDPKCAEQIRDFTKGKLHKAFDTISNDQTAAICVAAMSEQDTEQNAYSSLVPVQKLPREDVEHKYTILYTAFGEKFVKRGKETAAKPEDFE